MVFQRACVAFVSLGLIASAPAQTHAPTKKQPAKAATTIHRAPAAKGAPTRKVAGKKTSAKKSLAHTVTAKTVKGRAATLTPVSYANREATMRTLRSRSPAHALVSRTQRRFSRSSTS